MTAMTAFLNKITTFSTQKYKPIFEGILNQGFLFQLILAVWAGLTSSFFLLVLKQSANLTLAEFALVATGQATVALVFSLFARHMARPAMRIFTIFSLFVAFAGFLYLALRPEDFYFIFGIASVAMGISAALHGLQLSIPMTEAMRASAHKKAQSSLALVLTVLPIASALTLAFSGALAEKSTDIFYAVAAFATLGVGVYIFSAKPELPGKPVGHHPIPKPVLYLMILGWMQNISHNILMKLLVPLLIYAYSKSLLLSGSMLGLVVLLGFFISNQKAGQRKRAKRVVVHFFLGGGGVLYLCSFTLSPKLAMMAYIFLACGGLIYIASPLLTKLARVLHAPEKIVFCGLLGLMFTRLLWGAVDAMFAPVEGERSLWFLIFIMVITGIHFVFGRLWTLGFMTRLRELEADKDGHEHEARKTHFKTYTRWGFATGIAGGLTVYLIATFFELEAVERIAGWLIIALGVWLGLCLTLYKTAMNIYKRKTPEETALSRRI